MKITSVTMSAFTDSVGSGALIFVDTDEGISGVGEVGIRTRQQGARGILEHLGPLLIGQDPFRTEHLWQMISRSGFWPADRVIGSVVSAVDIALWDIKGKALGVPVYELLGGRVRDSIPCYIHIGADSPATEPLVDAALQRVEEGWRYLRLFVPSRDKLLEPRQAAVDALRQFEAVRTAVGDEIDVMIDVHTRLDPATATWFCRAIEPMRPFFVEDPLRAEAPAAYRRLRDRTAVPIAAGEQFASKWEFRTLIDEDLIDFARIDLCIGGGLTEGRKLAGAAEMHYIDMATHNPLGAVSTAAAAHYNVSLSNFGIMELAANPGSFASGPVQGYPEVTKGDLVIRDAPGLGIEVDRSHASFGDYELVEIDHYHRRDGAFTNW